MKTDKRTPTGTRDLLFNECRKYKLLTDKLDAFYQSRGYSPVMTPAVEYYDVFGQAGAYFLQEEMYKLTDLSGKLIVIRPDCTIPIARLVSTRLRNAGLPLRLFYSQAIYRMDPGRLGGSGEVRQMGVELIGQGDLWADIECIYLASRSLALCGIGDFRLEIGHIGFFRALISSLGADIDASEQIRELIERKNFPALGDLLDRFGQNPAALALKKLPAMFGDGDSGILTRARSIFSSPESDKALDELGFIIDKLTELGLGDKVIIDLGLVNQADYYTGTIFRGYVSGAGEHLLSGGRYDQLIGLYGNDLPATGFGINMDALCQSEIGALKPEKPLRSLIFAEGGDVERAIRYIDSRSVDGGQVTALAFAHSLEEALAEAGAVDYHQLIYLRQDGREEVIPCGH